MQHNGISEPSSRATHTPPQKRVPIQERVCRINDVVGINAYRANREALKQRFVTAHFTLQETPHFLIFSHEGDPTIVLHWFAPPPLTLNSVTTSLKS